MWGKRADFDLSTALAIPQPAVGSSVFNLRWRVDGECKRFKEELEKKGLLWVFKQGLKMYIEEPIKAF